VGRQAGLKPRAADAGNQVDCPDEKEYMEETELSPLPTHVAIIMDGNGRWARRRGLARSNGHEAGVQSMRAVTEECARLKPIRRLTLHAFGYENWQRPKREVSVLMSLLERFLVSERPTLMANGVRFSAMGVLDRLPARVREILDETVRLCRDNTNLELCLGLSYSGRQEIVKAARELCRDALSGKITPDRIDEAAFANHLDTTGVPDPDLLIRTSGDMRLSNFMLWQISYTELYFTDVCWPDFGREELRRALAAYAGRERRFGRVGGSG